MRESERKPENGREERESGYEAPEVESSLTPEEIEREVHYAGNGLTVT